jgi:hypothetical protein
LAATVTKGPVGGSPVRTDSVKDVMIPPPLVGGRGGTGPHRSHWVEA